MTNEEIETLLTRLADLPPFECQKAIFMTLGGCQSKVEWQPQTRLGEMFAILNRHVTAIEQKRGAQVA